MTYRIWTMVLAGLVVAAPARANSNSLGACDPAVASAHMPDTGLGRYCRVIREIGALLRQGHGDEALQAVAAATSAANALSTHDERAKARDEVRVAAALAYELSGNTGRASRLISAPPETLPDITALARAMMLARRGDVEPAADVLDRAVQDMPDWSSCSLFRNTSSALRSGGTITDGFNPATTMALPSSVWRLCTGKAALGMMPPSLTTHLDFETGRDRWSARDAERVREMVQAIRDDRDGHWSWLVAGHADQACPKPPKDCPTENMRLSQRRADGVAAELRRQVPERADDIKVHPFGMTDPIIDRPGKAEPRNRRVDLLAHARNKAERPTASCPWTVTVYDVGVSTQRRLDGGVAAALVLRPGIPTPVTRGSGFTVAYASGDPQYGHFYALSWDSSGGRFNLGHMGAVPSGKLADLTALGGRLPAMMSTNPDRPMTFRVGGKSNSTHETIRLIASALPMPEVERDLAESPLIMASADTDAVILPERARATSKGIVRPDWEPSVPAISQPSPGLQAEPQSPGIEEPAPLQPARIVPQFVDCKYIITWR